jgi:hypothetical protein
MKTQKTSTRITRKADKTPGLPLGRKPKLKAAAKPNPKSSSSTKTAAKPTAKKRTLKIPAILLEGDRPAPTPIRGPGQRYALGAQPPAEKFQAPQVELPEAYGTGQMFLTARDPHWLYAHWDFTREQLRHLNVLSVDGHLVLRVYIGALGGLPFEEVHVHPESRSWFVHVGRGGTKYLAELGYYELNRQWVRVSTSAATLTPPDSMSEDTSVRFETFPAEMPFKLLLNLVKTVVHEQVPLAEAIQHLRVSGHPALPETRTASPAQWTPAQERALAEVIKMDEVRRVWIGSLEITELIRRKLHEEISSAAAAGFSLPGVWSSLGITSPAGGVPSEKGFWFNVNAELIVYGATEPNAKVTLGGRPIKLRRDGTFSFRFALPDGQFELPAVATSAAGGDTRSAELKFTRSTAYQGEVGAHPQESTLKSPRAENIALPL